MLWMKPVRWTHRWVRTRCTDEGAAKRSKGGYKCECLEPIWMLKLFRSVLIHSSSEVAFDHRIVMWKLFYVVTVVIAPITTSAIDAGICGSGTVLTDG